MNSLDLYLAYRGLEQAREFLVDAGFVLDSGISTERRHGDMEFTREELWALEEKAVRASGSVVNQSWKRALDDLAQAASVLDAFIARSSVGIPPVTAESENAVIG